MGGVRAVSPTTFLPNTGWEAEGFRTYADYALTPAFRDGLEELLALVRAQTLAVMCAEALWWQCHRRIITDYLLVRSFDVRHILGPGETGAAALTPGASIQADGTIHYPPAQPRLL